GSKKAPMPVSNKTVFPSRSSASNARHASGTRLFASGASHFDHIAFGALPNIAPPSSFCELPRIDHSFMSLHLRARTRPARIGTGVHLAGFAVPAHHVHEAPRPHVRRDVEFVTHLLERRDFRIAEGALLRLDFVRHVLMVIAAIGDDLFRQFTVDV